MGLTIKQRGLTTQSLGVQNAGAPGDLIATAGSWTRRAQGPSLAGWALGWSAHNSTADAQHTFTISAASGEDHKGLYGEWYYIGPTGLNLGNHLVDLLGVTSSYGGNEVEKLTLNVSTMALNLTSLNARFADSGNIKTVRRNWWVWLALAWEDLGSDNWVMKVLYREAGSGATQVLYTTPTYTLPGGHRMTSALGGVTTTAGSGSTLSVRCGLPSLYQMTVGMADAAYPADIVEPVTGPYSWYVTSGAAGGGKGILGDPWNEADLLVELGAGKFTILSGYIVDSVGAIWDTNSLNADALAAAYKYGIVFHNGDAVYFDDTAGPIRPITPATFSTCDGVRLLPLPSLGRKVEIRGSTRISGFTLDSGNIYTKAITNSYGALFEFDDLPTANSPSGNARWLTHPAALNVAAYRAAATAGSFWSDGGTGAGANVWFWATGGGNPNGNGKVYEMTTGNDVLGITCRGALVKDLIIRYAATVSADNTSATDGSTGYNCRLAGDGLCVVHNCVVQHWGRHAIPMLQQTAGSIKQRNVVLNVAGSDGRPTAWCGIGGQSMFVDFGSTSGLDNQWYLEGVTVSNNVGVVGTNGGAVDATQNVFLEHSSNPPPNADVPYSKGWIINCALLGSFVVGVNTAACTIAGSTLGTPAAQNVFSGPGMTLTVTRSKLIGNGLPSIGSLAPGVSSATITNSIIVASGAIGTTPVLFGTIAFKGNTIDALAATGGTAKALATRGGVLALNFIGNIVRFNNGDLYRLFDTITPGSGDSLGMGDNILEGTDASRILVTSYAAATKTLAQLQAGGQDIGSSWAADAKLTALLQPRIDSPARGFVSYDLDPSLAGTLDFYSHKRPDIANALAPSKGKTDAGAILYRDPHREMYFEPAESN